MAAAAEAKKRAAQVAVDRFVHSNSTVVLGTGSTAAEAVRAVGLKSKLGGLTQVQTVATSEATRQLAESVGLVVVAPRGDLSLDIALDGADQVAIHTVSDEALPNAGSAVSTAEGTTRHAFCAIKGAGGALFREKLLEINAAKFVLLIDDSKLSPDKSLGGPKIAIPVEVVPFGWELTRRQLHQQACFGVNAEITLRESVSGSGKPFVTDNGNYILDIYTAAPLATLAAQRQAAAALSSVVGVVEHGLFIDLAVACVIGGSDAASHDDCTEVIFQRFTSSEERIDR